MWMSSNFYLTYGLLALAVLGLWLPSPRLGGREAWPWAVGLALASVAGLATGYLDWRAPLAILAHGLLAWFARQATQAWRRVPLLVLTGVAAFLFALHRMPGFHNAVLASGIRVSRGAPPFTLHANFDTAAAGIVLMGLFCPRIACGADWLAMLRRVWPVVLATLIAVLGLGYAAGYVRFDPKWTPWTGAFLALNLLFTCVTEEAFFRGFLLERFARAWAGWRHGRLAAVLLSTLLFGLAHAAGGPALVLLASVAGFGYAAAYLATRRIEGAILTHFALNAVHFLAFTYPAIG